MLQEHDGDNVCKDMVFASMVAELRFVLGGQRKEIYI